MTKRVTRIGVFFSIVCCSIASASALSVNTSFKQRLWGLTAPHSWQMQKTLYVSISSPQANDASAGTLSAPLRTIQRAIDLAVPGTRILISPGIYPESLTLGMKNSGTALQPILLEAKTPGTVILSGSDRWTGWQPTSTDGVYVHAWQYKWGVGRDIFGADAPMQPLGRRSEMVFVNGVWYRQVLDRALMQPGTFWVSEDTAQIFIQAPQRTNIPNADIQVSVRRQAIDMGSVWGSLSEPHNWPSYYVFQGLTIQHYTARGEFTAAATCCYGAHILIDDCKSSWNNGTGLELRGTDIVVRHCQFNHNGFSGISIPPTPFPAVQDVLLDDDVVGHNNWRGALGDFYGWAVAGMKMMTSGNVLLDHFISRDNASPGVWFDNQNRNIVIEHSLFLNNRAPGLWMEISPGPFLVDHSDFAGNGSGVCISNSSQITLTHDVFYGNNAQIDEWSVLRDREGNFDEGLTLHDDVMVCAKNSQTLWSRPAYLNIYDTLQSDGNLWWRSDGAGWSIGGDNMDFSQWILRTHQDRHSILANPRLRAPQKNDFTVQSDSPLLRRDKWGQRTVVSLLPPSGLASDHTQIYMDPVGAQDQVHYTLNGESPTIASPVYTEPFPLPNGGKVRAVVLGTGAYANPVASITLIGGAPPQPDIEISSLSPTKNVVGWGDYAHTNLSIQGNSLNVAGMSFSLGMGAHAPSELDYTIPSKVARFVSAIGVDDEAQNQVATPSMTFSVFADDVQLYKSEVIRLGMIKFVNVLLPPNAKTLRLIVTPAGPTQEWDHADWVRAGFLNAP